MKKLRTFILAALTAVGACAAFGGSASYIETDSTVWFDTASVSECSDYNTIYLMYRDSYDAWVEDGSPLSTLGDASICSGNFADGAHAVYAGGQLSFTNNFEIGGVKGDRTGQTAADFAILFSDGVSGYFLVDSSLVSYESPSGVQDRFTIKMQEANAFTSADLKPFDQPKPISAVSAEGFLDLTVGDRVAADTETLVVDPAWGDAKKATVKIDGEDPARTYNCASNDIWDTTTALVAQPGRYEMKFTAGATNETAAFWKLGMGWEVLDNSQYNEGIEFQAGTTYLVLNAATVPDDKSLTVVDGAKFEYGEGAGFIGGQLEMPRRYRKEIVEGDLYRIVEAIKGCEDNPWDVGVGVEAYTNGTDNLVIVGAGTIADLSEIPADVKRGIAAITVADATVKDAAAGSFFGFDGIKVTLQDNWKGEVPDEKSTWHGATNVELTRVPTAVKNVKVQQRYPWNGKVDVDFDLTGAGDVKVTVLVTVDGKKLKNPTVDGETTFDLGTGKELKDLRLTWDAKADFKDEEVHQKIKVKLTVAPGEAD